METGEKIMDLEQYMEKCYPALIDAMEHLIDETDRMCELMKDAQESGQQYLYDKKDYKHDYEFIMYWLKAMKDTAINMTERIRELFKEEDKNGDR